MELNKKTIRNIFFGVGACIVLYWLLHETERLGAVLNAVGKVFSPFIVGAAVAFILNVPMRGIEKMLKGIQKPGGRRALAIVLTLVALLVVLAGVIWLLVPQLMQTAESLAAKLPGFFQRLQQGIMEFLNDNPELLEWVMENTDFASFDWAGLIEKAIALVGDSLSSLMDKAISTVGSLSSAVVNAVMSFVFAMYCLASKETLARQGRKLLYAFLPEKICDETVRILRLTNSTFSNFIAGQCLEALILGSMFAVAMLIFGMPYIPLVSVIISLTAFVPIVGAFVGCILGAFFILVDNPVQAVWFVVMFLVLQQIEGNMIYPRVVGTSIGLSGMWVLLAVAVGGDLMGVGGMLLMIPLASVAYTLLREITGKRLAVRDIDAQKLEAQPPEIVSKFKEKRKQQKEKWHLKKQAKKEANQDKP